MGTISFAQVPPTAATIALNAYIFGFGGHSLVTPHTALKQLWWTDDRIESKVTRKFVVSQIKGEEREFLDKPLAFGEGLTNDTYMEWILGRARRLFLILAEIGKPEQVLGLIDDSLDDDDLPFSLESITAMDLSVEPDEKLTKKFYASQFQYLLRQSKAGSHIDYGPQEHIPMEKVYKVPPAVTLQSWDRIHFPQDPDQVFLRRKFVFGNGEDKDELREQYLHNVEEAKRQKHPHIVPVWSSYTAGDSGYILSDFVPEHTLASFIAQRTPYQFMRVPQRDRPVILLEWMHCLADALAMLHHRGIVHEAIRPSNILIDHDNCIAFADIGSLPTFQRNKKTPKNEIYDYAAPEVMSEPEPKTRGVHFHDGVAGSVPTKRSSAGSLPSGSSLFSSSPPKISSPIFISSSVPMGPIDSPMSSFSNPQMPPPTPLFRNFSRRLPPPPTIASASISGSPPTRPKHRSSESSDAPSDDQTQSSLMDDIRAYYLPAPSKPIPIKTTTTPHCTKPSSPLSSPTLSTPYPPTPTTGFFDLFTDDPLDLPLPLFTPNPPSTTSLPKPSPPPPTTTKTTTSSPHPSFKSDIYSLGTILLDLSTYIIKGHLSTLQKFKSQNNTSNNGSRSPMSSSLLHTWLAHLASEAQKLCVGVPVLSVLGPILGVVRDMLAEVPERRPEAEEVRERLGRAMAEARLLVCCGGRVWGEEGGRARLSTTTKNKVDKEGRDEQGKGVAGGDQGTEGMEVSMMRSLSQEDGKVGPCGGKMKRLGLSWMKKG